MKTSQRNKTKQKKIQTKSSMLYIFMNSPFENKINSKCPLKN